MKGLLEQLFGSKTRVRLMRLFLDNPESKYYVRELTRRIGAQINAVRTELLKLKALDLVVEVDEDGQPTAANSGRGDSRQKRFYQLNTDALIYPELKALFLKSRVLLEKDLVRKLSAAGSISYLALTGLFVGEENAPTDLLVVGRIRKEKLAKLITGFEHELGREINYTALSPQEYRYRKEMTDRFLFSILESKKLTVIDTLNQPT
jgi:hypothetical protein